MIGAKMAAGVKKLREEIEAAEAEGKELPSAEAGWPVDLQNQIRKKLGDLPANLIVGVQEKIEAVQEAVDDLDEALDVIETLGNAYEITVKQEQRDLEATEPDPEEPEVVIAERMSEES